MNKVFCFAILALFLLCALPMAVAADKAERPLELLTSIGSYSGGILKLPSNGEEYVASLSTEGLANDFTFSGNVKIRTIGPNPWSGIGFVIGYTNEVNYNQILITKSLGIVTRNRVPSGWAEVGISDIPSDQSLTLQDGTTFTFEIYKKGLRIALKINNTLIYDKFMGSGNDMFSNGSVNNIGIFNSESVLELTDLKVEDNSHIYKADSSNSNGPTEAEESMPSRSTGYLLDNKDVYPNKLVTTTATQNTSKKPATSLHTTEATTTVSTDTTGEETTTLAATTTPTSSENTTSGTDIDVIKDPPSATNTPLVAILITTGAVIVCIIVFIIVQAIRKRKAPAEKG